MKKSKVFFAIIVAVVMFNIMAPHSKAEFTYQFEPEAWQLHRLGLFAGASVHTFNPDLGAPLTRQVGVTLLLNFFGKRSDVEAMTPSEISGLLSKYKDQSEISEWARPYLAYAVKTGMVVGTSGDTISPNNVLDGYSLAALILRQLGYVVDRTNFTRSLELLSKLGGIAANEVGLFNKSRLLKDHGVGMIYTVLFASTADGQKVAEKLIESGYISVDKAVAYNLASYTGDGCVEIKDPSAAKRPSLYDQIYYGIYEALANFETYLSLPESSYTDTPQKVFKLIERCLRENPELLYYSGCIYFSDGTVKLQYSKDSITGIRHQNALKQRIKEIVTKVVAPGMTEYEKELALHDYLIENCKYDRRSYENKEIPQESFNAYGALCLGTAVCEGYAEAMKLLLNRAGVECHIVTGVSKGERHAWNIVKIDGETYHLDATYNDPVMLDGRDIIRYHYFNLSDEEIETDHEWDETLYPSCNSTRYNYYVYNSLIISDTHEFIRRAVEEVNAGNTKLTFRIQNAEGFDYVSAVRAVCNRLYRKCSVTFNEAFGIVDMVF